MLFFLAVTFVSLLFQGTAVLLLYGRINWNRIPLDKPFQVFCLAVFVMLLIPVYLSEKFWFGIYVFAIKIFCCLFTAQALGTGGTIYLYMALSIMADISVILPVLWGLFCSPLAVLVILFSLRPHTAGNTYVPGICLLDQLLLFFFSITVSGIVTILKYYFQKNIALNHEVLRMSSVIDRITNTNLAYQNYAAVVERSAIERERQRISREIHDIIGYTMTNVLMLIQAAQSSHDEKQVQVLLDKAQKHLRESVDDARLSLRKLRDSIIQPERGRILFSRLTKTFSDITGIKVCMDFANLPESLNINVEQAIFRMLEESMTNTFKHGSADLITIHFLYKNGNIIVRFFDNGSARVQPGTEVKEGIGLRGMRERIEPLGGTLVARFIAGGFLLRAVIPGGCSDE